MGWYVGGSAVVLLIAIVIWLWVPRVMVRRLYSGLSGRDKEAEIEDKIRVNISQMFAAAAIIIGSLVTLDKYIDERNNANATLMTGLFNKAIEQMSDAHPASQIAGTYSLEQIAQKDAVMRERILRIYHDIVIIDAQKENLSNNRNIPIKPSIQSIMYSKNRLLDSLDKEVVVAKMVADNEFRFSLPDAILNGADLHGAAGLKRGFLPNLKLQCADLRGAVLDHSDLQGSDLEGADLRWGSFRDVEFWNAGFVSADLKHAKFHDAKLHGASFRFADVTNAEFQGAKDLNLDGACSDGGTVGGNRGALQVIQLPSCAGRQPAKCRDQIKRIAGSVP